MEKKTTEYIVTAILVIIFIVLLINNLKPKKKKRRRKPVAVKTAVVEEKVKSLVKKESSFKKNSSETLSLQKKRAELDWGRDPFYKIIEEKEYHVASLVLKGISLGRNKKGYAFINNEIVTIGDKIEGFKVVEITRKKVLLKKNDEKFYLVLPEEEGLK